MFFIIYLTTVVFIGAVGFLIFHLTEQRVQDVQTISRLRYRVRDLNNKVEDLERELAMLKVF
jgi:cell division protein FtsL